MGDIVVVITMQFNRNAPEQFSYLKTRRCTHIYTRKASELKPSKIITEVISINSTINTGITRDESPFLITLRENESIIKPSWREGRSVRASVHATSTLSLSVPPLQPGATKRVDLRPPEAKHQGTHMALKNIRADLATLN